MKKKYDLVPENGYVYISAFMVNELHLKGNELFIYALIYGFTISSGEYSGSLDFLTKWTQLSKQSVINILNSLIKKKLVVKTRSKENLRTFEYKAILADIGQIFLPNDSKNLNQNVQKTLPNDSNFFNDLGQKTLPRNIYNNNNKNMEERGAPHAREEFKGKIKKLKQLIQIATDESLENVEAVFRESNYSPETIDLLMNKISSNPFLMGKKESKPNIATFVYRQKIEGILQGIYDERKKEPKKILYGNVNNYKKGDANERVKNWLKSKTE